MHSTPYELKNIILINYSLKNIDLPSHHQRQRRLIQKAENIVHRTRWKAYFFLTGERNTTDNNKYRPPNKSAPPIADMKAFEEDVIQMISNVKFRKSMIRFLKKIEKDLKSANSSERVMIFADKTRNMYEVSPETCMH